MQLKILQTFLCSWCVCAVFPLPSPDPVIPCKQTVHKMRQRKGEKAREKEREASTKWPFWILSKGLTRHYGDVENSPECVTPLILRTKGIQSKLDSLK